MVCTLQDRPQTRLVRGIYQYYNYDTGGSKDSLYIQSNIKRLMNENVGEGLGEEKALRQNLLIRRNSLVISALEHPNIYFLVSIYDHDQLCPRWETVK